MSSTRRNFHRILLVSSASLRIEGTKISQINR